MQTIYVIEHADYPPPDTGQVFLREQGFNVVTVAPCNGDVLPILDQNTAGVMIMGGGEMLTDLHKYLYLQDEIAFVGQVMACNIPLLGICLGAQIIAKANGARVGPHPEGLATFGFLAVQPVEADFVPKGFKAFCGNTQGFDLPENATLLASGNPFPNQAFRIKDRCIGLQFHPELTRETLSDWQKRAGDYMKKPGTHSFEQQDAGFARYGAAAQSWYRALLAGLFEPQSIAGYK